MNSKSAKADVYYKTKNVVNGYSQPSLTKWVSGANQGDTVMVTKIGWYGNTQIAYVDSMNGWTKMDNLVLSDAIGMNNSESIAKLSFNTKQYLPSIDTMRKYYYKLGTSRHPKYVLDVKRTTGIFNNVNLNGKPLHRVKKHTKLDITDIEKYGKTYRFELEDGNYITAARKYVKLTIIEHN